MFLIFIHIVNLVTVWATLYTIPQKVAMLFMQEEKIIRMMEMVNKTHRGDKISEYLASYQQIVKELSATDSQNRHQVSDMDILVGDPVHVYNLMDRLVNILPGITKDLLECNNTANIGEKISSMMQSMEMPTQQDMDGVSLALARIQFAYR